MAIIRSVTPRAPVCRSLPVIFAPVCTVFFTGVVMIEADGVERFFPEAFELPFPEFPEVRFRAFLDRSFRESSKWSSVEECSFFFTSSLRFLFMPFYGIPIRYVIQINDIKVSIVWQVFINLFHVTISLLIFVPSYFIPGIWKKQYESQKHHKIIRNSLEKNEVEQKKFWYT